METWTMLMLVVVALAGAAMVFSMFAWLSTSSTNGNITKLGNFVGLNLNKSNSETSNIITTKLNAFTNASTNTISTSLSSQNAYLNSVAGGINRNISTISSEASGMATISSSISGLTTGLSTGFSTINSNTSKISPMAANVTKLIHLASQELNLTRNISTSNTMINFTQSQNEGQGGYAFGTLPAGFDNYLKFNATVPITLEMFSFSQYNSNNNQLSYNQWCQTSSNNNANSIGFWFNYTPQSQQSFTYVVYAQNSLQSFRVVTNTTSRYNSSLRTHTSC